ncbi:MAG: hypothetical protein U1E73_01200 [Planctomycetota bacterium]
MNLTASLALPALLTLGLWSSSAPPSTAADAALQQGQHQNYNLRSLRGRHGFTYQGNSGLGLVASSGRIDFDGFGNLLADYTTSVGGVAFTGSFTGTYTVNANGTGSVTLNLPQPGAQAHGNFVLVDGGDETFFTSTDLGYSVVGRTRRM